MNVGQTDSGNDQEGNGETLGDTDDDRHDKPLTPKFIKERDAAYGKTGGLLTLASTHDVPRERIGTMPKHADHAFGEIGLRRRDQKIPS